MKVPINIIPQVENGVNCITTTKSNMLIFKLFA